MSKLHSRRQSLLRRLADLAPAVSATALWLVLQGDAARAEPSTATGNKRVESARPSSPQEQTFRLRELLQQRWEALRDRLSALRAIEEQIMLYIDIDANLNVLRAELEICDTLGQCVASDGGSLELLPCDRAAGRIGILVKICDIYLEHWLRIDALHSQGRRGGETIFETAARAAWWTAEIELKRECVKNAGTSIPERARFSRRPVDLAPVLPEQSASLLRESHPGALIELAPLLLNRHAALLERLATIRAIDEQTPQMLYIELEAREELLRSHLEVCDTFGLRFKDDGLTLEACDKPACRIAIHKRIVEARLEIWRRVYALHAAGRRGGEDEQEARARAGRLAAEIDLWREYQANAKTVAAPASPAEIAAKIRQLILERITALRERHEAIEAAHNDNGASFDEVIEARAVYFKAELENCGTPAESVAIREKMLVNRQTHERYVERLRGLGRAGGEDSIYLSVKAERLQAEIDLLRERTYPK
jgi:hypothetical protein